MTQYAIHTILNGTVTHAYDHHLHRDVTHVDGEPVTFTFTNRQDLETNVLGSIPCSVLAENVGLVASAGN